jgi:hypothetical protein
MSAITTDQIKEKIKTWVMEYGFQIGQTEDQTAEFHLTVTNPVSHLVFDVIKPKSKPDMIVIAGGFGLAPNQLTRMRAIQEKKREAFLWDIKFQLISSGYEFQFQPMESLTFVEKVIIQLSLWYDGISKHSFMSSLLKVNKGLLLALWKLNNELGTPSQAQVSNNSGIG